MGGFTSRFDEIVDSIYEDDLEKFRLLISNSKQNIFSKKVEGRYIKIKIPFSISFI